MWEITKFKPSELKWGGRKRPKWGDRKREIRRRIIARGLGRAEGEDLLQQPVNRLKLWSGNGRRIGLIDTYYWTVIGQCRMELESPASNYGVE